MTTRELIQRVQVMYSRGVASDDSRLSNRHIYSKLRTTRSRLLSQRAKDRQKISQWNYQTLPCVELELAPIHECPCLPSDSCKILKSKYPIPRVLADMNRHLIQSVTTLDGQKRFDETSWEAVKNQKGNKYTKNAPGFFIRNEHLYLTNNKVLEVITMTALFADPDEAANFISLCSTEIDNCIGPLDREFPIDGELTDGLIQLTYQEVVALFSQFRDDKINSANDDTSAQLQNQRRQ